MKKKIIISGLLAFFVVMLIATICGSTRCASQEARRIATHKTITVIEQAFHTYKEVTGEYPKSVEDLTSPVENSKLGIHAPIKKMLNDGWGTPFQIKFNGDEVKIRSAGPDLKMGTADDITN